ncbi:MAG: hypothetical protein U0736_07460 [Gemmataceae bacterium]
MPTCSPRVPPLRGAVEVLGTLVEASLTAFHGVAVVGLPMAVDDQLFNCAAVVCRGRVLGIVPKSFLPNYKEFYEAPAATACCRPAPLRRGSAVRQRPAVPADRRRRG